MPSCGVHNLQLLEVSTLPAPLVVVSINSNQALRALQNPALFTSEHYKQAALAVAIGIAIRIAISVPVRMPRHSRWNIVADVEPDCWNQDIALVPLVHTQFRTCNMGRQDCQWP
jgi:hypothetical protein